MPFEQPKHQSQEPTKRDPFLDTIYGSMESGFSHIPKPGTFEIEEPAPQTAEQLIKERITNLTDSATNMQRALNAPTNVRAMRMAGVGSVEERLATMKRISDRQEQDAIEMKEQADVLMHGMNALARDRAPAPAFRGAVEHLLAMTAQNLKSAMARDEQIAKTSPGYVSWGTKTERLRMQAYQSLLDRIDQSAS